MVKLRRIVIADDHAVYRSAIKTALAAYKDIAVIGEAENGQELLDKLQYLRPDVVITGFNMPVMDGMKALVHIRQQYPAQKVIMMSILDDASHIRRAIENGVNAYLLKTAGKEEIYEAITTCHQQWFYINAWAAKAVMQYASGKLKTALEGFFNKTELHILKMLQEKEPDGSIALACNLSERTLVAVIERMKQKTGKDTVEELLQFIAEEMILD